MKTPLPAKLLKDLSRVASLTDRDRRCLVELLTKLPGELYPFDSVAAAIDEALESTPEDVRKDVRASLPSLLFLMGASVEPPTTFIERVQEKIATNVGRDAAGTVASFLREVVSTGGLLVSFKATALYEDNERLLMGARTLIDVRPVFDPQRQNEVGAHVLLYKLRMTYRTPTSSDPETLVLTMRKAELTELAETIRRVEEKTDAIRRTLGSTTYGELWELK